MFTKNVKPSLMQAGSSAFLEQTSSISSWLFASTGSMASQACPFCPFSHRDSYFLMHHVEVCHPETGESPFSAKEYGREESASAMDAPAKDDYLDCEYIPCECGEIVTLAEFPTHMELHKAEGMTFDSDALNVPGVRDGPVLDGGEAPFAAVNGLPPVSLSIALHGSSSILAPSSVMKPRSRGTNYKSQYGTQHCYEQPLGSPQSTSRNKIGQARHKSVRRLGVCLSRIPLIRSLLTSLKKAELGPHAYEERMPASLRKQLERGAKVTFVNQIGPAGQLMRVETVANETHGVVPVLSQLCEQDRYLSNVFLCHPEVQHVVKMSKEGGFCGYRNIQMMISFIQATGSQGHENLPGRIPSIFQLQDLIEGAWDQGINSSGRIETGGIRGTRKYIGTPEVSLL